MKKYITLFLILFAYIVTSLAAKSPANSKAGPNELIVRYNKLREKKHLPKIYSDSVINKVAKEVLLSKSTSESSYRRASSSGL